MSEIHSHDTIHCFCTRRGTGTASLKSKLLKYLTTMVQEALYDIFLYFHKSCDALDCVRCLKILAEYYIVPQAMSLLQRYLERLYMVVLAGGCFGDPFKGQLDITQGDPLYPMIFNVVVTWSSVTECLWQRRWMGGSVPESLGWYINRVVPAPDEIFISILTC